MRRRLVILVAACIAATAFAALPEPAASRPASEPRQLDASAFRQVVVVDAAAGTSSGPTAGSASPEGRPGPAAFVEPGVSPAGPVARPRVNQPGSTLGESWKPPRYTVSGYATFYDHGTTAMRLPRGTVVRICGAGGCIERVVNDYGPANVKGRIVDLYRPDFFAICGCASWSGTTWVTVSVY